MSFFSDLFGKEDPIVTSTVSDSTKTENTQSGAYGSSSSSFWSNLLGSGGAGSSLISSAGTIGIGLVKNDGAKIQADYQLKLAELTNQAASDSAQFKLGLNQLNAEREAALAEYNDQKRNDYLLALGIIGAAITIVLVAVVVVRNRNRKPL